MSWKNIIKKDIEDEFDEDVMAEREGRMEGVNNKLEMEMGNKNFTGHDVKQQIQFYKDELIDDAKDIMKYIDSVKDKLSDKEIVENVLSSVYRMI
tara:strand:+ start:107 stop:391 length:285 start_codon:yes stop_codon:yes gene_type:complete